MIEKISVKRGVQWVESDRSIALFYLYGSRIAIQGAFVESILDDLFSFLQIPRSSEDIMARYGDERKTDAQECVSALKKAGLVYSHQSFPEGPSPVSPQDANLLHFLSHFLPSRQSAEVAIHALHERTVSIVHLASFLPDILDPLSRLRLKTLGVFDPSACGEIDVENYPELFSNADVGKKKLRHLADIQYLTKLSVTEVGEERATDADLVIVVANWFSLKALKHWNRRLLRENRRWLFVVQDFFGGSIGPWFGLADGACFECLQARRALSFPNYAQNKPYENYFENNPDRFNPNFSYFSRQLGQALSIEVLKILLLPQKQDILQGIYEFDFLNHRSEFHPVTPLPSCEACGPFWQRPLSESRTLP